MPAFVRLHLCQQLQVSRQAIRIKLTLALKAQGQRHIGTSLHNLRHVQGLHLSRQRAKRIQHSRVGCHDISSFVEHGATVPRATQLHQMQNRHLFGSPFCQPVGGLPMTRRNWKGYQPATLRDALQGCKDFALQRHNLGVERIAEHMDLEDHWALYKWIANGRMPLVNLHAYEHACGIDLITRYLAATAGKLLVDIPKGTQAQPADMVELNTGFANALQLLKDFYQQGDKADPAATLEALRNHLEQVAYHQRNVAAYATPELEF